MDIIINSDCNFKLDKVLPLVHEGDALLHFLIALNYNPVAPPLADFFKKLHHLSGQWLILSPVKWEATHNDAMIVASNRELQLEEKVSRYWFDKYANYLAAEHIKLYYHDAKTWLLQLSNQPPIHSIPVHQLKHKSLMPELAQLDNSLYWQKFVTEAQMFFASPLNPLPFNGIWLWGGGRLGDKKDKKICVDEAHLNKALICSNQVSLYNNSVSLKTFDLILIEDINILSEPHQKELTKITARWYWNNTAYYVKQPWYTRIWRTLIHAH